MYYVQLNNSASPGVHNKFGIVPRDDKIVVSPMSQSTNPPFNRNETTVAQRLNRSNGNRNSGRSRVVIETSNALMHPRGKPQLSGTAFSSAATTTNVQQAPLHIDIGARGVAELRLSPPTTSGITSHPSSSPHCGGFVPPPVSFDDIASLVQKSWGGATVFMHRDRTHFSRPVSPERHTTLRLAHRGADVLPFPPTSDVGSRQTRNSGVSGGLAQLDCCSITSRGSRNRQRQNRKEKKNGSVTASNTTLASSTTTPPQTVDSIASPVEVSEIPTFITKPIYQTNVQPFALFSGKGRLAFPLIRSEDDAPYALGYRFAHDVQVEEKQYLGLLKECQGMRVSSDHAIDNIRRMAATHGFESYNLPRIVAQQLQFQRVEDNRFGCSEATIPLGQLNCLAPVSENQAGSASTIRVALTLGCLSLMEFSGGLIRKVLWHSEPENSQDCKLESEPGRSLVVTEQCLDLLFGTVDKSTEQTPRTLRLPLIGFSTTRLECRSYIDDKLKSSALLLQTPLQKTFANAFIELYSIIPIAPPLSG